MSPAEMWSLATSVLDTIDNVGTLDNDDVDRLIAGRYRLRELLGRGGMASVHRADDESLGRTVAVKIFHAGLAHAQDAVRQREETSLLASLNHPGLVTLFDAASDGDESFLVMEFVDGDDLGARMRRGPLDSRSTALIGADVAGALAYIHGKGVVHRDVKPANILLAGAAGRTNPTHAKLADFGIARLIDSTHVTAAGSLVGTASYLSPEQAEGHLVGAPSDVYSLSLSMLECLTGERAFPGSAVESTVARLNRDPTIPVEFGPAWATLLRSGTARDAAARPTAAELASWLREMADSDATLVLPVAAASGADGRHADDSEATVRMAETPPPPRAPEPPRAPRGRGKLVAIAAGAIILIVAAAGLWSARPGQSGDASPDSTSSDTTAEVSYPAVDGDLGLHLGQLQQSVAP